MSGRDSKPFLRLSVIFWRSSSCCAAWSALFTSLSVVARERMVAFDAQGVYVRCSICVQEDIPSLEVFGFRAVLKVFLEGVASFWRSSNWRDWGRVNEFRRAGRCHVEGLEIEGLDWFGISGVCELFGVELKL